MKKNRFFIIVLALLIIVFLYGCRGGSPSPQTLTINSTANPDSFVKRSRIKPDRVSEDLKNSMIYIYIYPESPVRFDIIKLSIDFLRRKEWSGFYALGRCKKNLSTTMGNS